MILGSIIAPSMDDGSKIDGFKCCVMHSPIILSGPHFGFNLFWLVLIIHLAELFLVLKLRLVSTFKAGLH